MLVRDAPELEVFMLRRNLNSDFVGGAYVFPGGGVDEADRDTDLERWCDGRSDSDASKRLGLDRGGLAFWVAAIRECFEEAGVLLARHRAGGEVVDFTESEMGRRFGAHRKAVDASELRMADLARSEDLVLDAANIHYWAHWITPPGPPRRYDTRFFIAAAPPGQVPLHDDRETVESLWIRPRDALDAMHRGELTIIFPTQRNLERIAGYDRTEDLLADAKALTDVVTVRPRMAGDERGMRLLIPGDDGYEHAVEPSAETIGPAVAGSQNPPST